MPCFLKKTPQSKFLLSGWRFCIALRLSANNRYCFGPKAGSGRLVTIAEDHATLNFDAIIQEAREIVARGEARIAGYAKHGHNVENFIPIYRVSPIKAYEKALADAEYELVQVRVRLNEVVERLLAGRQVAKSDRREIAEGRLVMVAL